MSHFFALPPAIPPQKKKKKKRKRKIRILKKWKKLQDTLSFYICVPKIKIIWFTVPEIWSGKDRIFCHFGQFFALPLKSQKIKILKKMGKALGDIIRANKGRTAVSYLQSSVFDHPNLSYDDHCNHRLFQKIFFLLIYFLFPRNCF